MFAIHLTILALATWRLSSLVATEDGPLDLFLKLRVSVGMRFTANSTPYFPSWESWLENHQQYKSNLDVAYMLWSFGKGLCCPWCNSVWFGLLMTVFYLLWPDGAVALSLPLSLSAAAIVVDAIARR